MGSDHNSAIKAILALSPDALEDLSDLELDQALKLFGIDNAPLLAGVARLIDESRLRGKLTTQYVSGTASRFYDDR